MLDIVFCNVPYVHLDYVYSAPAILKGVVQKHGFSAKTIDFGIELFKICERKIAHFYKIQNWFLDPTMEDMPREVTVMLEKAVSWFRTNPSNFIGISVLSFQSQVAALLLIQKIKHAGISSKIIIGGRGIQSTSVLHKFLPQTKAILHANAMDYVLTKLGLIDHAVRGDGEESILDILSAHTICHDTDIDLFQYPVPDYNDYELDCYQFEDNQIRWPIKGSKGCVRECDFCDVRKLWGKYRYRSGRDIANEMIYLNQTVGARRFQFNDSLVNGGLRPFTEFMNCMADFNEQNPNRSITWQGQYICRPTDQISDPDAYYSLLYRAGGRFFYIGAESGSNDVLASMNKKTTVESLFNELTYFRKYGITCTPLLMIGHWSETHEDFLKHLDMLIQLAPFVRSGTVTTLRIGLPALILEGTPSYINIQANGIKRLSPAVYFCSNNTDNTISEKVYRQLIVLKLAQTLNLIDGSHVLHDLNASLVAIQDSDAVNNFYATHFETISSATVV